MTNKLLIPGILAATVLVAGIFALMPVDRASTVHTTILQTVERPLVYHLGAGSSALTDVPIAQVADNREMRGLIAATITDSTQTAGNAGLELHCTADQTLIGGADQDPGTILITLTSIDAVGESASDALADADNCEVILADIAPNTEATIVIDIQSIV